MRGTPLAALLRPPEKVEALVHDDSATLALWREAMTESAGGDRQSEGPKSNPYNMMNGTRAVQGHIQSLHPRSVEAHTTLDSLK